MYNTYSAEEYQIQCRDQCIETLDMSGYGDAVDGLDPVSSDIYYMGGYNKGLVDQINHLIAVVDELAPLPWLETEESPF